MARRRLDHRDARYPRRPQSNPNRTDTEQIAQTQTGQFLDRSTIDVAQAGLAGMQPKAKRPTEHADTAPLIDVGTDPHATIGNETDAGLAGTEFDFWMLAARKEQAHGRISLAHADFTMRAPGTGHRNGMAFGRSIAALGWRPDKVDNAEPEEPMSNIEIRHRHSRKKADARAAIERIAEHIAEKFDVAYAWDGDQLAFDRSGVHGLIKLVGKEIQVSAHLSFFLAMLRGPIEAEIRRYLDEEFGPESNGGNGAG